MSRPFLKLPSFDGVAAGQTATLKLPIGFRYHQLFISYAGVTLAQLTEIRVLANGKLLQRFSATERDILNQFDGRPAAAGILVLPFDRYGMKNRAAEEETALNTGVADSRGIAINSLHIEIDIDAAAAAPVLSAKAERSAPVPDGPGLLPFIYKMNRSVDVGEFSISDIPYGRLETQALEKMMLTTTAITSVRVERDTFPVIERTIAENDLVQTEGVRVPVAGYEFIDFTERGYAANLLGLVGLNDFALRMDVTGAGNIPMIVQYAGALNA